VSWLRTGPHCASRQAHSEMKLGLQRDLEGRAESRRWLEQQEELRPLLVFEAECVGKAVLSVKEPAIQT
jgi:hypothetical protein